MAATLVVADSGVDGDHKYIVLDVTGDSSYATGGYDVSTPINSFFPVGLIYGASNMSNGTHSGMLDSANKKVVFRLQTTGAEVASTTDVHTSTVRVRISGL